MQRARALLHLGGVCSSSWSPCTAAAASVSSSSSVSAHQDGPLRHFQRSFAAQPAPDTKGSGDSAPDSIGNDKVRKLADEIVGLTVLECSWLAEILRKKLNMQKPAYGAMPAFAAMPVAPAPAAAAAAAPAEKKEEKKEKTEFDVKLESFTAEGKIKVIKEIRALTSLGLKEAKELVEKAPIVFKSGVSKADAEAMKKQLESAGAKVSFE